MKQQRLSPNAEKLFVDATGNHVAGHLQEAERLFRAVLAIDSKHSDSLHLLGVIAYQCGHHDVAIDMIERAISIRPNSPEYYSNLGIVLKARGKLDEAVARYRHALALRPNYASAHNNLGNALKELGKLDEAIACYRSALALQTTFVEAHNNLGNALKEQGDLDEAAACYRKALVLQPNNAEALNNLGTTLREQDKPEDALAFYRRALALQPNYAEAHNNLANALKSMGRHEEAVDSYRRAIALKPKFAEAYNNLGAALKDQGRLAEAEAQFRQAVSLKPHYVEAYINLGNALRDQAKLDEAVASCRRALILKPNNADAYNNLGLTLLIQGRLDEALACFNQAIELTPGFAIAISNRIFALDLAAHVELEAQQAARKYWWDQVGSEIAARPQHPYGNELGTARPIVLGYVSGDFRRHSAALAIRPILENHDKKRFKLICYSCSMKEDDVTRDFQRLADKWWNVTHWSDEHIVDQIRSDRVDILIDLSGHSGGNRLRVFAHKPAPVQVTAWGHATGTGLPTIDYLFSDRVAIPLEVRHLFSEKIYDLPCLITMEAPDHGLAFTDLPMLSKKFITFGSFNRISKISEDTIAVWSEILRAVPHSQLMIKDSGLNEESARARLRNKFAHHGIAVDRIVLRGSTPRMDHLAAFKDVDIALDPFPQNGGISTWEALHMGVPVIATLGCTPASRLSGAILAALGLDKLVSRSTQEYLDIATKLAVAPDHLQNLRHRLPTRISESSGGNAILYTEAVENAYIHMWQTYVRKHQT